MGSCHTCMDLIGSCLVVDAASAATCFTKPVPVQIPGYEPEQLSPNWRAVVQEVWDHSAAEPGTVKHVCVQR